MDEFSEQEVAQLMRIFRRAARLASNRTNIERRNRAVAQRLFEIRRVRSQHVDSELFGEPGWDMLLMLYANADAKSPLRAKDLALGSEKPVTTALRWQATLEEHGLITPTPHPKDGRVTEVRLTDVG